MRSFKTFFERQNVFSPMMPFGFVLAILCFEASSLFAQVSGTVFRDFNANGIQDNTSTFAEPAFGAVTVTAYPASGPVQTTTSATGTGTYSFTGLTLPARIEFSGFATGYYSGPAGAGSASSVQFVSSASSTTNFGVNYPSDYCQSNPELATSLYVGGTLNGLGATEAAFIKITNTGFDKYIGQAGYTSPTKITDHQHIGAIYGSAYARNTKKVYAGAVLRRHAVYGPLGIGGIYEIDPATNTVNNWLDLESLAGIDAGTDTRNNADPANAIPADPGDLSYDYLSFGLVGKTSLGDVEISDDGTVLYVINVFQQSLIAINVNTKALIGSYPITATALGLSCPQGDFRPWGLKYYRGKLYVGAVCTAQTSQLATDLKAYVLEFDPNNAGAGFSIFYNFNLNYTRETSNGPWNPWNQTSFDPGSSAADDAYNPQPILSNIEFDVDGSMILGFLDRHAMMFSSANGTPDPTASSSATTTPFSAGDILRICKTGSGFALEGTGVCPTNFTNGSAVEFYDDRRQGGNGNGNIKEDSGGSLAFLPGSNEIISTAIDEYHVNENGIAWWNNSTGVRNRAYVVFDGDALGYQGKTSGIGDIEILCNPAPLEIGNRIWMDTNDDGIQDADEMGIGSVPVKLFKAGVQVGATTTATDGTYYFNNSNVTMNGATGLLPNMAYVVRVDAVDFPSGKSLSPNQNVGGAGQPDVRDNDAALNAGNAEISVTTGNYGENNHTLDIAFKTASACSLTSAGETLETCNNNGTTASGADDYITFSLNPTGTGLGASYSVTASGGATVTLAAGGAATGVAYGNATAFRLQNGSANGTLFTITVTDVSGACTVTTTVQQNTCSISCPPIPCGGITVVKN